MKKLEQTILIKGIALVSTLVGLQQWISYGITPFDLFFIMLVAMFLISVEHDYFKFKDKTSSEALKKEISFGSKINFA